MSLHSFFKIIIVYLSLNLYNLEASPKSRQTLQQMYAHYCNEKGDMQEHIPTLRMYAQKCESVVEIGVRAMVSTWGLLLGLAESPYQDKFYIGIDLEYPPHRNLTLAQKLSKKHHIHYEFLQANDRDIEIPKTDLLFIDSLHTYCHLTYELEKFSSSVHKYIIMHDTSEPWGDHEDYNYQGDYSEYPAEYDRSKKGLWPAVQDFLERHPEWTLHKRYSNCHGLTILERIQKSLPKH